ncbi:MAG: nickel-dependent hydrogenase large subunit [Alsobacter sp.]
MSRILVGPFNRVEGDLEVALDVEDGVVSSARVTTTLYRGFEQILVGRAPGDSLVVAPRICGICSVSQSLAAAAALRAAHGLTPARNGMLATNIAHAAENLADHLTHFYLFFMPDFARAEYAGRPWHAAAEARFKAMQGSASRDVLPARARLLNVMGLIAGKWPHSLAFQPGGVTRTLDLGERMRLAAIVAEFAGFLEETLFGAPLDAVLALDGEDALGAFAEGEGKGGDAAHFLRIADDLDLAGLGRLSLPLMSYGAYPDGDGFLFPRGLVTTGDDAQALALDGLVEDHGHAWMAGAGAHPSTAETVPDARRPDAYSWAKAPRLDGSPVEVGAVARQAVAGHPLVRDLIRRGGGTSVRTRVVARLLELALVTSALAGWVRDLDPRGPFCSDPAGAVPPGGAVGLVEAARGSLGHWLSVKDGRIAGYQIVAPTTWNFSPRDAAGIPGPAEQALAGTEVGALAGRAAAIQHVIRSFDPCMVCTAH